MLHVPFREASVWQDYEGEPERHLHIILGRIVPGPIDTWMTYSAQDGLEFAARPGLVVRAAASGVVTFVGDLPDRGRVVVLEHRDGYQTTYTELGSSSVSAGWRVEAGDEVGRVAGKGTVAGFVHLGLQQRQSDGSMAGLDPTAFLDLAEW